MDSQNKKAPTAIGPQADEAFIRRAVDASFINALRMALYQTTRDPELLSAKTAAPTSWSEGMQGIVVVPEDRDALKERLVRHIMNGLPALPPPQEAEARKMVDAFAGRGHTEEEYRLWIEELMYEEFPRSVEWTVKPDRATLEKSHVIVVGAGIGGIAAAIQLKRLGIPFIVIERHADVGGTWYWNDYPEARVDVPSRAYHYGFEADYPWQGNYATQAELKAYLDYCVDKYGLRPLIRFNNELTGAIWDEDAASWCLEVRDEHGEQSKLQARFMISAVGIFTMAKLPDIAGLETFKGKMFHTTTWDHSADLKGKRIGLIGNGSSGAQLMPALAREGGHLTQFMRTPSWFLPVGDYRDRVPSELQWLLDNVPYYRNWHDFAVNYGLSRVGQSMKVDPEWQKNGGKIGPGNDYFREKFTEYIKGKIGHKPALLEKCIPTYPPLSKRPIADNGWLDALNQPNVDLVTDKIERITPRGVMTADGKEHEFDVLVVATGYEVAKMLWPVRYQGRDGLTLEAFWSKDGPRAYMTMTVPHFPNFFMLSGPNPYLGASGFFSLVERWIRYSIKAITTVIEGRHRSIDCRPEVYDRYNEYLDKRLDETIYGRGADMESSNSYYFNEFRRCYFFMPWEFWEHYQMTHEPNLNDFVIT